LGEYELLRKIGSGGMAEVWMGRRAAMAGASKAVAIKLLARNVLDDPTYRQMFLDEARLSMLLTNSNVVQVFDVGEVDGECFMVMEWVDGLNLSELTRKALADGERIPTVVAAHIVGEVLRALAYAHGLHHEGAQATIVHRDVSPQNVLVSISGEVKLADFGVARLAHEETSGLHVKGKLRYMAPEQLRGRSREPTVDLYAVGAILHELLAGERFRQTRDEADLYSMVLSGEYPRLDIDVPRELDDLRLGLLEPDPKRRIQTADEALELLYAWPGYRNSAIELAKLARRWVGVQGPRSGIASSDTLLAGGRGAGSGPGPDAQVASAAATVERRPASAPSEAVTAVEVDAQRESGPQQDRGVTETRTFGPQASEPETAPTTVIPAEGRAPVSSLLIVAAITLALSFGVFGLGFPLGWWGGGHRGDSPVASAADSQDQDSRDAIDPAPGDEAAAADTTGAEAETAGDGAVAPAAEMGAETEAETGEPEADDLGAGDESDTGESEDETTEGETGGQRTVKKATGGSKEPAGPPAEVKFLLEDFRFVYVKVAGRELPLEPTATVKLKPGRYRVKVREDPADPWKTVSPRLEVEPGGRYNVRVAKPAKIAVEKL
jgi:tRNA A-37 threonylcarbamoyl transferase component Bud32